MRNIILFVALFQFAVIAVVEASGTFSWSTVAIGGGGFVSAIVPSPVQQDLFFARTDVGGAYRWDQLSKRWISMMDWVDISERGLLGVEAIAADPRSADRVYMVAGTTYWNEGRSTFLRSSDRGVTWEAIYTWDTSGVKGAKIRKFYAHGNGMGRGNGEALAIDPANSSIIFYWSKANGLFKSIDNGTTWNHVDGFTAAAGYDTTWNGSGFSFVTFAPKSSTVLYAGFLRSNNNVFESHDGGTTWYLIPGNPLEMVASSIGYRGPQYWYNEATGKWNDQWGSNIYYTSDGGAHWIPSFQYYWMDGGVNPAARQMNENGIGWFFNSSIHWSGCIVMDPFTPKQVLVTSGNGVFATDNITAFTIDSSKTPPLRQSTVWKVLSHGIEEVVPLEVVSYRLGRSFRSSVTTMGFVMMI